MNKTLRLWSPSEGVARAATLRLSAQRLGALGWQVHFDGDVVAHRQRRTGSDEERLAVLHRVAAAVPDIAMATGGGHGLTRLLDGISWKRLARSVERGTRWVGHGDLTQLQLGLLAHTGAASWSGPMACEDFGRDEPAGGAREAAEVTRACFAEAMDGSLEAVGFRTAEGFDGLGARGPLWGGALRSMLSLLGTPHWPGQRLRKGVLFIDGLEGLGSVQVEQGLLQLRQAGVLQAQRAVLLGLPAQRGRAWPADRGLPWTGVLAHVRQGLKTPLLVGLPAGPSQPRLTLPQGRRVQLVVQGREVLMLW